MWKGSLYFFISVFGGQMCCNPSGLLYYFFLLFMSLVSILRKDCTISTNKATLSSRLRDVVCESRVLSRNDSTDVFLVELETCNIKKSEKVDGW